MLKGMCKGINCKSLAIAAAVMFVYIFLSDFLIHGFLLKDAYQATATLWRPEAEMHDHMCWMMIGKAMIAIFFTVLFAKGYEGTGMGEGVRFGLLIGLFSSGGCFLQYAVSPIPSSLMWSWIVLGLIQYIIGGIVVSMVYKKPAF